MIFLVIPIRTTVRINPDGLKASPTHFLFLLSRQNKDCKPKTKTPIAPHLNSPSVLLIVPPHSPLNKKLDKIGLLLESLKKSL